jgi:xanthine dehydrogenase accessory factor
MADDTRPIYTALNEAQQNGIPVALATVIETQGSMPRHAGAKLLIYGDGRSVGTVGGGAMESKVIEAALNTLQTGKAQLLTYTLNSLDDGDPGICGGTATIFVEAIGLQPTLLVIGGGHVGQALCELGQWAGYRVILSDDRPEYCNPQVVQGLAGYIVCKPAEIVQQVEIGAQTYIAAVTRGLPVDIGLIPTLLETPAPYIGLIGSRRRWAITAKALMEEHGIRPEALARVHAPIGLELEAETPKEIAVSILAEVIMIQRGGTGVPMHEHRKTPEQSSQNNR